MNPTRQSWTIGHARVSSIVELEAGCEIQSIIPQATKSAVAGINWLGDDYIYSDGSLKAVVQSLIVEIGGYTLLVDTCVGNGKDRQDPPAWSGLQTDFLSRLSAVGFPADSFDYIICTHLHYDHVGWNTIRDDRGWSPTFPNARYILSEPEYLYWSARPKSEAEDDHAGFSDSIKPVVDFGQVDLVRSDAQVVDGVTLLPSAGHTPGHVCVMIQSAGESAVLLGDVVHHPVQFARPHWTTETDTDKDLTVATRRKLCARFADSEVLVIGSHFAEPSGGYIQTDNDAFRFGAAGNNVAGAS